MTLDTQAEQEAFDAAAFRAWMRKVDAALETLCGLGSDDLPDYSYRDAYDGGEAPISTAVAALEDVDFDTAE
jgi:hypothetical protein